MRFFSEFLDILIIEDFGAPKLRDCIVHSFQTSLSMLVTRDHFFCHRLLSL